MNTRIHIIQTHIDGGQPRIETVTTSYDHAEKKFNDLVSNFLATYKTAKMIQHGDERTEIVIQHPNRRLFVDWVKGNAAVNINIK